jgi:(1->4)-alpha-D-glucan 1-alpha-D-glucosylmutase
MKQPRATYRLQLSLEFGFAAATDLLPYLRDLGISHVYLSPCLRARPRSTHGYDIVDHNSLNPELGSPADFERLCATLRELDMGLLLDFVPNHMGIGHADNRWWLDVLEWGESSPFAAFFDINWSPRQPALQGKVLLPLLGDHYGKVLERGELALSFDEPTGGFSVNYFEHRFPISPSSYRLILGDAFASREVVLPDTGSRTGTTDGLEWLQSLLGCLSDEPSSDERGTAERMKRSLSELARADPETADLIEASVCTLNGRPGEADSFKTLHHLLEQQHYRLAFWRVAADEINYRRFFDINELAGIRMERQEVFDQAHRLIGALIAEGELHGLRLDHVDGLLDPVEYFERLQRLASKTAGASSSATRAFYIVVEKILERREQLVEDWQVAGTTGYEFINLVNGVFVDPASERSINQAYYRFLRRSLRFDEILHSCKIQVIDTILASELNSLAAELDALSERHWTTRDYTQERLREALKQVVAGFSVYRTYISARGVSVEDRRYIEQAVRQARRFYQGPDPEILDFVHAALTTDLAHSNAAYDHADVLRFAMRFQQYTGPVMAKSLEDTCLYRCNRLLSLNEVGSDPQQFGVSPEAFHRAMQDRARRWPFALLPTATHDTKRGADVRARLNVLAELPAEWGRRARLWAKLNRAKRPRSGAAPAPNDEYMIYQTLLGAWPATLLGGIPSGDELFGSFRERVKATVLKSIREAKQRTSWSNPDVSYEQACMAFVERMLDTTRPNAFLEEFLDFLPRIAWFGMLNGLCQSVIAQTAPGVPDIYQGSELWNLDMVDPDNRRPVDFERRRRQLEEIRHIARLPAPERCAALRDMLREWSSGRVKLALIAATLECRRQEWALFAQGDYWPLQFSGAQAGHVFGFARYHKGRWALVVAGRLFAGLIGSRQGTYPGAPLWRDTVLVLPHAAKFFQSALTGRTVYAQNERLEVSEILDDLPAAVLLGDLDQL